MRKTKIGDACRSAVPPKAGSQKCSFALAQPSFDFVRDKIQRGQRFLLVVFRGKVVTRQFVADKDTELLGRPFVGGLADIDDRTERVRRIFADPANLPRDSGPNFVRQFQVEIADDYFEGTPSWLRYNPCEHCFGHALPLAERMPKFEIID